MCGAVVRAVPIAAAFWLGFGGALGDVRAETPGAFPAEKTLEIEADRTEELLANEGRDARVVGVIQRVGRDEDSGILFLNFGRVRGTFVAVIFPRSQAAFGGIDFEAQYGMQRVVVEGPLSIYDATPQIVVTTPEQISVLAE